MRMRLNSDAKEVLKLRSQLDNAYHIIRKLSDKKIGVLLGHIISKKYLDINNHMLIINGLCYKYVINNSKDYNLSNYEYFEISAEKGNHLTVIPIHLSQI